MIWRRSIRMSVPFFLFAIVSQVCIAACVTAAERGGGKAMMGNQMFVIKESDLPRMEKDALAGSGETAFHLWQFYELVKLDYKEALYWATISAENGYPSGEYTLGFILRNDPNARSKERALYWLRKCARRGDKQAIDLLKGNKEQ